MNIFANAKGFRSLLVAAACTATATGFAALQATAADGGDIPKVTVRFGDLDLSRPDGATALYRRIRTAAEQVCGLYDGGDLGPRFRMHSCMQRAIAEAVTRVNNPELYAVYRAHNRTPLPPVPTVIALGPAP